MSGTEPSEMAVYDAARAFIDCLDPLVSGEAREHQIAALASEGMPEALRAARHAEDERLNVLATALRRICTAGSLVPGDPLDDAYRAAGGGYGGLQAMAKTALEMAGVDRAPAPAQPTKETYTREQIRELLLSDEALKAAFDAGVKPARPRPEREDHRRTVRSMLEAALRAIDKGKGGEDG